MNMKEISTVFKKEIKDLFRDKKTVIMGVLIPLIMFPIIMGVLGNSMSSSKKKVEENMKISISDKGNSSLNKYLSLQKGLKLITSKDIKKDVQDGKIYVGVMIPENFEQKVKEQKPVEVKLIYDDSTQSSQMALGTVQAAIDTYTKIVVKSRLVTKGIDLKILEPLLIKTETTQKEETGFGKYMLALMLPMLLLMYTMSGPMPAAIDLGAGEKERGTMEPLLTTQSSRMNLLFGKLFAITTMGIIGTIASIIGVFVSFKISGNAFSGGEVNQMSFAIPVKGFVFMGLITMMLTMAFGALELAVSIYARSFKEAQTYLTPFTIIGIVAAYGTFMMDVKNISSALFNIPLINVALILKEIIYDIYNPVHLALTFGWVLVYIIVAIFIAKLMYSREEVIFRT